jgi:hypothetical protein
LFSQQQPAPYVQTPLAPEATDQSHVAGQLISGTRDEAKAKIFRNKIIHELLVIDDDFFILWSQRLHGSNAIGSSLTDFSTALLGAFAAASGASSAKSLGLAVTGIMSGRMAIKEHIFLKEQASALISTMEEDRARISTQIDQYLKKDINEYPLEYALRDVLRYYQAGTLASASMSLANSAGERAREAAAINEFQKGDRLESKAYLEKVLDAPQKMVLGLRVQKTDEEIVAHQNTARERTSLEPLKSAIVTLPDNIDGAKRTLVFFKKVVGDVIPNFGTGADATRDPEEVFNDAITNLNDRGKLELIQRQTEFEVQTELKADIKLRSASFTPEKYKKLFEGVPGAQASFTGSAAERDTLLANSLTTKELVGMREKAASLQAQ